jgi:hypothetical protein
MFVYTVTLGWNGHISPTAFEVIKYSLWLLLAACGLLVAVGIWKNCNTRAS